MDDLSRNTCQFFKMLYVKKSNLMNKVHYTTNINKESNDYMQLIICLMLVKVLFLLILDKKLLKFVLEVVQKD